jgi:hypothetical protein
MVASAQWGEKADGRWTYGRSMIVDPWGTVLGTCPDRDGYSLATLDLDSLDRLRTEFPALATVNRKLTTGSPREDGNGGDVSAVESSHEDKDHQRDRHGRGDSAHDIRFPAEKTRSGRRQDNPLGSQEVGLAARDVLQRGQRKSGAARGGCRLGLKGHEKRVGARV